jgi:hypothetical protein
MKFLIFRNARQKRISRETVRAFPVERTCSRAQCLDLEFLYKLTRPYYGESGQKSIDPIVFFKLCLVGYLENIISDRDLIQHSSMRLDILYFLGYDIDEPLPWHSTISRTRQLYPEAVFENYTQRYFIRFVRLRNRRFFGRSKSLIECLSVYYLV